MYELKRKIIYRWTRVYRPSAPCNLYECGRCGHISAYASNFCPDCGVKLTLDKILKKDKIEAKEAYNDEWQN